MVQPLPQELISHIISYLHDDLDKLTLRNLSLTSSRFLPSCQTKLFRHICLTSSHPPSPDIKSPGERLLDLLTSSPRVLRHVEKLTIDDIDSPYASWLSNDAKVAEAINKLNVQQIKSFSLQRSFKAEWLILLPEVKAAILKICQSPSLVHLSIRRAPITLLGVCSPSLKHLEVLNSVADRRDAIAPIPRNSPIVLESLHIYHHFDLDRNIKYLLNKSNGIDLDSLERLQVLATSVGDHAQVSRLLKCCLHSLKSLIFTPCIELRSGELEGTYFSLDHSTGLDSLELRVDVTAPDVHGARICLVWAKRFIKKISAVNTITKLRFVLEFDLSDVGGKLSGTLCQPGHGSQSLRLLGEYITRFPHLRELDVEIQTTHPHDDDGVHIETFVKDSLAISSERLLLTMKTVPHVMFF